MYCPNCNSVRTVFTGSREGVAVWLCMSCSRHFPEHTEHTLFVLGMAVGAVLLGVVWAVKALA